MIPLQEASYDIWSQKHRLKNQAGEPIDLTPEDTYRRVAKALAKVEKEPEKWEETFYQAIKKGCFGGGRIMANAGAEEFKPKVSLINCTVSGNLKDSIEDILQKNKEAGQTLGVGCGIGYCFSSLRPKGAFVNGVGADTSGCLSFMGIFDTTCGVVVSAGGRRGAQMGTLHVWHPDIEDFIKAKRENGKFRQFNLSVLITNDFMQAVKDDLDWKLFFPLHKNDKRDCETIWVADFPFEEDYHVRETCEPDSTKVVKCKVYKTIKARDLWNTIMRSTYDFADPGFLNIDLINAGNPLNFVETIIASNPCLHPDSLIETIHGRVRIADITEPTKVYTMLANGSLGIKNASASFISARQVKTLKITTRNGKVLRVTPNHRIKVHETEVGGNGWREAKDLRIGDRIVQLCRARRGAAYSGVKLTTEDNRAYRMEHVMVANAVYGVGVDEDVHHLDRDTYNNSIDNLEVMPHGEHSRHTALNDNPQNHQKYGQDGKFVPNGGTKAKTIVPMPESLRSNMKNNFSSTVISIEEDVELVDVYDLTVEDTHNFIADFCVVHNCGEQPLPPYGSCLLGSINLVNFVENPFTPAANFNLKEFSETAKIFARMLDNVVELNGLILPEQQKEILTKRRHGMGYLGLGSALCLMGIKYGSPESVQVTEAITRVLAIANMEANFELGYEKGSAPIFEDSEVYESWLNHPLTKEIIFASNTLKQDLRLKDKPYANSKPRWTHGTTLAPTGTLASGLANNASNGIEPSFTHEYRRNLIKEGKKTKEVLNVSSYELLLYRHLVNPEAEPFTEDEAKKLPDYFISCDDLTPKQHIDIQAAAQKWIDSAISKTINVPTDFPFEDFEEIYLYAYEKGLKGCTTFRFNPEAHQGVLVKESDLENTKYKFTLDDGSTVVCSGNETIQYDGESHSAANLFDALKEGTYGKY